MELTDDFPMNTPIYRGFPIATCDYPKGIHFFSGNVQKQTAHVDDLHLRPIASEEVSDFLS